jgi:hypothetical protein
MILHSRHCRGRPRELLTVTSSRRLCSRVRQSFALDAIPHVDYPIKSRSVNPRIGAPMAFDSALLQDAVTIGLDGLLGIAAALLLFSSSVNFWAIWALSERCFPTPFSSCTPAGHMNRFGRSSDSTFGRIRRRK